jgi:phosphatidylserine decarboxylase
MREQQPLWKKLKLFALFNPLTEWIDTTHAMRLYLHNKNIDVGHREASPSSKTRIKAFVDFYHIKMSDFSPSDIAAYPSFAAFFIRAHRPGTRPIHALDDDTQAVVVADSRVVVYETVAESKRLWIKGLDFTITQLTMDTQLGPRFDDGAVASFRLSPQDYHRFHSPVSGRVALFRSMPGDFYQVDPMALRSEVDILTRNARDYVLIESEEFGEVVFVAVGAEDVGTVKYSFLSFFFWIWGLNPEADCLGYMRNGKSQAARSKKVTN